MSGCQFGVAIYANGCGALSHMCNLIAVSDREINANANA